MNSKSYDTSRLINSKTMRMNTIAIIFNSKHKKQLKRIEREIKGKFNNLKELEIQIFKSSNNVSLRQLAVQCAKNFQTLIAVGGDGTLHDVLNGIFEAKKENTCILGFIPIGSANDFHKTLNGAKSVEEIIHKLEKNSIKNLSIGKVTFSSDKSNKTKRYFINIASLGMGYEVMQKVGLPVCPADAAPEIKAISQYISPMKGGAGCVRDVIEKVLKLKGLWI